ncbi:MAG TPA: hypothetical protein VFB78_07425 [Acidimicrobiales bacterium]|nr:hypothetical protein [Acidimicrobiales bacterium]
MAKPTVRIVAVAAAVCVVTSGCGTAKPPTAASIAVVRAFVTALQRRDFDAAMSLRCSALRQPAEQRALFLDQLDRLQASAGPIEGVDVAPAKHTGLTPVQKLRRPVEVRYTVRRNGTKSAPMFTIVGDEKGHRRLCGQATGDWKRAYAAARAKLRAVGPSPTAALPALLPPTPAGSQQIDDGPPPADRPAFTGQKEAWTRAWQTGSYGGERVTAWRYDTSAHALAAAREQLRSVAGAAIEAISVPPSGASGVRLAAFSALGVQTPDVGPYVDYVYAVYGRVVVLVAPGNLPTGATHDRARALLSQLRLPTRSST